MCTIDIALSDDDLLLRTKLHKHPLFIKCYICEKIIHRILVDDGSAVIILPLRTMKELGIATDEFSPSRLMIQGFH